MTTNERDQLIMEKLNEGMSLSDVQQLLDSEYGIKLTYLDLRMISSSMAVEWEKQQKHKKAAQTDISQSAPQPEESVQEEQEEESYSSEEKEDIAEDTEEDAAVEDEEQAGQGKAIVNLDEVPQPGTSLSGTVVFPSGASGKWILNRMGQLGLSELDEGSSEPTQEDYQAFQAELQGQLAARSAEMERKAFDGRTKVEISPLVKPGCDMNGTVTFASGAHGEWFVAEGRLDYAMDDDSTKPTREDLTYFQLVLQKTLREKGMG